MDIQDIQNAFSPAHEIIDPNLFAGRRSEIRDGIISLNNTGSFLTIYGLRGSGKSSVAYQIGHIARGDKTLSNMLQLTKLLPRKRGFNFIVHYVKCDIFIKNTYGLIKRILFGDESNPSLFSMTKAGEKKFEQMKNIIESEASANIFGVKLGLKGKKEEIYQNYISDDLIQQFRQVLGTVQKDNQNKSGILILIDEFDTIKDKSGFSSIIKTCSSPFVKFGIIGIANTITELVEDHASIGRQIESINVRLMSENELAEILSKAVYRLGRKIIFDEIAQEAIIKRAEGFPYFVQLLGREAMLLAYEFDLKTIDKRVINFIREKISEGRLKTIYEEIYHSAVKNSPQRELMLKAFSEVEKEEIFSEDVYRLVKELDVTNPSQLMKELTSPEKGVPILVKIRDKYYRFSDPVFKVYAKLRNWKYES